jgi:uncharacterized membrane protein
VEVAEATAKVAVEEKPPSRRGVAKIGGGSFEQQLGARWIIWLGALLFLGGVAFALKYSYDNNFVGPAGRLAMGILSGVAAVVTGDVFRRKQWMIPFQAFSGGGFAIFYIFIYFACQVYDFAGQGTAMTAAVGVTVLAVTVAVMHNAVSIAILAVVGGYASPIFLSTGENHPYILFTYVCALNLVALGSGWFRRWRALNIVCFAGTALLYQGWFSKFFVNPEQLIPALIFTTIFYLTFLAAPTLYTLVRRMPEKQDTLTLVVGNAAFSLFCYYQVLFSEYRQFLGFVVIGQAFTMWMLYRTWHKRCSGATHVGESLLVITLALVTLAIPLQLRLYGIPIAWAVEGTLFIYMGLRFRNIKVGGGGAVSLLLAAGGLFYRLPLHEIHFTPVLNRAFGSWALVALAIGVAAYLIHRLGDSGASWRNNAIWIAAALSGGLVCLLLTMETSLAWSVPRGLDWGVHRASALLILWTALPGVMLFFICKKKLPSLVPVVWVLLGFSILTLLWSYHVYDLRDSGKIFGEVFLCSMLLIGNLYVGSRQLAKQRPHRVNQAIEIVAHALLSLTITLELLIHNRQLIAMTEEMAIALVSAVWATHGCLLIWHGLVSRRAYRRYTGFVLFGIAAVKTVFVDTFELAEIHRIFSWLGCGALLVIAALLYQRYSMLFLGVAEESADEDQKEELS